MNNEFLRVTSELRESIREAEWYLAQCRAQAHGKRHGWERDEVREMEANVEYLRRELHSIHLWAEALIKGVELPPIPESEMTKAVQQRIARKDETDDRAAG